MNDNVNVQTHKIWVRISIAALAIAIAICFLMPVPVFAARREYYTAQGLKAYRQHNYKRARTLFLKEPKYKEPCVVHMSSARKKAYSSVIRKYKKSRKHPLSYVNYTDINKDGHAEMILKYGTCEADFMANIYEYYGGKVHCAGKVGGGHTYFVGYPGHNGVIADCGHMGGEMITVYKLKNHRIYSKKYGVHDVKKATDWMEFKNELACHNWNYA